jgi:hypothetical protein
LSLLQKEEDRDVSKIPSDSKLNQMIARSPGEIEAFNQMDRELEEAEQREWEDLGNTGPRPSRLMDDDELPEWLRINLTEIVSDPVDYGRGMRNRGEVCYDDNITDARFEKVRQALPLADF